MRVLTIVLLLLLVDGVYLGVRAALTFRTTVAQFQRGASGLATGDLPEARRGFNEALASSAAAGDLVSSIAAAPWRLVPPLNRDAGAAEALARAGGRAAQAGLQLVSAAAAMGVSKDRLGSAIYRDGRVRLGALHAGEPFIAGAAETMTAAAEALQDSPSPVFLRESLEAQQARFGSAARTLTRARVAFGAMPSLLGEETPRRYYLAFQAPSEQRGGGGLISLWGILTADRGRLILSRVRSITELVPLLDHPVKGPSWFRRLYGPMSGLSEWQQANSSPNFPVVGRILLRMYTASTGRELDGVIGMDPVALGYLTRATGPLRAGGLDVNVGPSNAVDILLNKSYSLFPDPELQNLYLGRLIDQFWQRLSTGAFDAPTLVGELNRSIEGRHFKVFSVRREEQRALQSLGAAAGYEGLGPNLQSVFHNNGVPNKVDYFLHRTIDTSVELTQRGEAQITTTAILRNSAPKGPPSNQLGPSTEGRTPGLNRMILEFLLPEGARLEAMELSDQRISPLRGREENYPVAWQIIDIPPGSTAGVTVRYSVPHAFSPSADGGSFSLTMLPQAAARPDEYVLRITPPYGFRFTGEVDDDTAATFSGLLASVRTFTVQFESG